MSETTAQDDVADIEVEAEHDFDEVLAMLDEQPDHALTMAQATMFTVAMMELVLGVFQADIQSITTEDVLSLMVEFGLAEVDLVASEEERAQHNCGEHHVLVKASPAFIGAAEGIRKALGIDTEANVR